MEILTQIGYWRRRKNKRALNDIIAEENGSDGIDDPANIDEALDKKLTENQVLGRKRLRVVSESFQKPIRMCAYCCDCSKMLLSSETLPQTIIFSWQFSKHFQAELKLKQCLDELFVSDKGDENEVLINISFDDLLNFYDEIQTYF